MSEFLSPSEPSVVALASASAPVSAEPDAGRASQGKCRSRSLKSLGAGLLLAALGMLSATTPALAKTADEVVKANLKAVGGDAALAKQSAVILQGTATRQNATRNFTWSMLYPQSFREDISLQGLSQTTVITGTDGWARALNGVSSRLQGAELEQAWLMNLVLGFGYLKGDELELTYSDPVASSDGKGSVLTVTARKLPAVELTFDNGSGLLTKASIKGGNSTCVLTLDDQKKVGTLKMPHKVIETCQAGSAKDELKYEVKVSDLKTVVDETLFERSALSAGVFKFPTGQTSARPDFKYDGEKHLPMLKATVGGESRWFLIDATLPYSLVEQSVADALKLAPLDAPLNLSRQATQPLYLLEKMALAEAALPRTAVMVGALPPVASGLKEPVAGVLGRELLEHLTLEVDYAANALTVYEPSAFTDRGTAESLRVDEFGRVNALFNGQSLLSVWLATAHPGTVTLPTSVLEQEKLLPASDKRLSPEQVGVTGLSASAQGDKDATIGSFASVQLGQLAVNNVLAAFPTGTNTDEPALGNQVLERFKLTFDLHRQQVLIEQGTSWNKPWVYNRSGIKFKAGDALIVESLLPGADTTLMAGDQLLGVQNAGVWSRDVKLIKDRLREPAGTRLKLKVKRAGKEIEKDFELKELL